ncbi:MAG TPA: glycosyltransferase family 2 protein [Bacteroidales bacterium]|nr:glycosyltransferase family 2 protein [Bacteroidales bacterium]
MLKTAVVILNWNGRTFLEKFLGNVISYSTSPACRVFVADNGSTDGSADLIRSGFPQVKLIELDRNYGFAEGYNLALAGIDAEYFILLNSDIEVTEGWAMKLTSFMDNHPEVAACQPKILAFDNRQKFEYAGAAGGYIDKFGYPFCRGRIFDITETDAGQYDSVTEVFWTSGACMIVRSDAWKKCRGLDPSFFAHMEEIDLCWRMRLLGYRLYFTPDAAVYHVGGGALPYNSPFKTYLNFRNNLFLLYKNLPVNKLHGTLLKRKLLDALSAVFFLFKGQPRNIGSIWKAHMDYYKAVVALKKERALTERVSEENASSRVLNKSIVFEFYVKRNRTFDRLKKYFPVKE